MCPPAQCRARATLARLRALVQLLAPPARPTHAPSTCSSCGRLPTGSPRGVSPLRANVTGAKRASVPHERRRGPALAHCDLGSRGAGSSGRCSIAAGSRRPRDKGHSGIPAKPRWRRSLPASTEAPPEPEPGRRVASNENRHAHPIRRGRARQVRRTVGRRRTPRALGPRASDAGHTGCEGRARDDSITMWRIAGDGVASPEGDRSPRRVPRRQIRGSRTTQQHRSGAIHPG
jgi:hypothetical protein